MDANDNLKLWDAVKRPPQSALKTIKGGRLTGMTDISPQWRYQAMTEQFGPCGIGWKFEIKRTWLEAGTDGQQVAFVEVGLCINMELETSSPRWSDPIPGIGGSMYIAKESSGLRTSDEAFKMATTDALSVAMKMLGVGADIYMGLYDGSKYTDAQPTVKIDAKAKKDFAEQVRSCLSKGDEHGLKQLWSEWSAEEKIVLWGMFNSQERSSMKAIGGDA